MRAPLQLAADDSASVNPAGIDFQVAQFAIGTHQDVLLLLFQNFGCGVYRAAGEKCPA